MNQCLNEHSAHTSVSIIQSIVKRGHAVKIKNSLSYLVLSLRSVLLRGPGGKRTSRLKQSPSSNPDDTLKFSITPPLLLLQETRVRSLVERFESDRTRTVRGGSWSTEIERHNSSWRRAEQRGRKLETWCSWSTTRSGCSPFGGRTGTSRDVRRGSSAAGYSLSGEGWSTGRVVSDSGEGWSARWVVSKSGEVLGRSSQNTRYREIWQFQQQRPSRFGFFHSAITGDTTETGQITRGSTREAGR